jgi:hypothetical protein
VCQREVTNVKPEGGLKKNRRELLASRKMAKGEEGAMPVWTSSNGNVDQIGRTETGRGGEGVYMQGGDSKESVFEFRAG